MLTFVLGVIFVVKFSLHYNDIYYYYNITLLYNSFRVSIPHYEIYFYGNCSVG